MQVWVAVVAGAFVIGQALLGHYLANARESRDLRASLERDVELLKKLRPGSHEARLLERHVSIGIGKLVWSEQRRAPMKRATWLNTASLGVFFLMLPLAIWRWLGVPPAIDPLVTAALVVMAVVGVLLIAATWWEIIQYRRKLRRGQLSDPDVKQRARRHVALTLLDAETDSMLLAHKDEIVAAYGMGQWSTLVRMRLDTPSEPEPDSGD